MRNFVFTMIVLIAVISCKPKTNSNNSNANNTEQIAGGWIETEMYSTIQEALNLAINELQIESEISEVTSIKQQVVSGMNYEISFKLKSNETWIVVVYKNLDNELKLTKADKL